MYPNVLSRRPNAKLAEISYNLLPKQTIFLLIKNSNCKFDKNAPFQTLYAYIQYAQSSRAQSPCY